MPKKQKGRRKGFQYDLIKKRLEAGYWPAVQMAKFMGISSTTIYRHLDEGHIQGETMGKRRWIEIASARVYYKKQLQGFDPLDVEAVSQSLSQDAQDKLDSLDAD